MSTPATGPIQSISTLSMVTESQRKLTTPSSSVNVQNKWSYTPLLLNAFTVQTRTSLALLIPIHEIYKTVKLCIHVYINMFMLLFLLFDSSLWHITAHTAHSYVFYTWAMSGKHDRNNMKLSKGGNGFITTQTPHVSINDDQLIVHSTCWQVVPTSVVVVNDNTAWMLLFHYRHTLQHRTQCLQMSRAHFQYWFWTF
jgi:hypothetical protein